MSGEAPPVIGAMRDAELPEVSALVSDALGAVWTAESLRAERSRHGAIALTARVEGSEVVGVALGWAVAGELEVSVVAVSPTRRRAGVGRALVEALLEGARALGASTAFLDVRAGNAAALALYRAAGFAETGRRRAYYRDGEDAVQMSAALPRT